MSGEPGLNRRPSRWQRDVLPLNYRRLSSNCINFCKLSQEPHYKMFSLTFRLNWRHNGVAIMVKEILSDFSKSTSPASQPTTFQPYFSTILTIVTATVLMYGIQVATSGIHTFVASKNTFMKTAMCTDFDKISLKYLCGGIQYQQKSNYNSRLLSFEQDLQSDIK